MWEIRTISQPAGAAQTKATAELAKAARASAARNTWEEEEGGLEVRIGDDGSEDELVEEERLRVPVGFLRGDYSELAESEKSD